MGTRRRLPRRRRLLWATLGLAALATPLFSAGSSSGLEQERAGLLHENAQLALQAELAAGKEFYLVLDVGANRLRLCYQGAPLREFPVLRIEQGHRRLLYLETAPPKGWAERIWSGGLLDPLPEWDRVELDGSKIKADLKAGIEEEVTVPPTPEEAFPAPGRFRMRFQGGLTLELVASTSSLSWIGRLRDAIATLLEDEQERDALRIRLVLDAQEAGSLYRSVPPETKFILLPPART